MLHDWLYTSRLTLSYLSYLSYRLRRDGKVHLARAVWCRIACGAVWCSAVLGLLLSCLSVTIRHPIPVPITPSPSPSSSRRGIQLRNLQRVCCGGRGQLDGGGAGEPGQEGRHQPGPGRQHEHAQRAGTYVKICKMFDTCMHAGGTPIAEKRKQQPYNSRTEQEIEMNKQTTAKLRVNVASRRTTQPRPRWLAPAREGAAATFSRRLRAQLNSTPQSLPAHSCPFSACALRVRVYTSIAGPQRKLHAGRGHVLRGQRERLEHEQQDQHGRPLSLVSCQRH